MDDIGRAKQLTKAEKKKATAEKNKARAKAKAEARKAMTEDQRLSQLRNDLPEALTTLVRLVNAAQDAVPLVRDGRGQIGDAQWEQTFRVRELELKALEDVVAPLRPFAEKNALRTSRRYSSKLTVELEPIFAASLTAEARDREVMAIFGRYFPKKEGKKERRVVRRARQELANYRREFEDGTSRRPDFQMAVRIFLGKVFKVTAETVDNHCRDVDFIPAHATKAGTPYLGPFFFGEPSKVADALVYMLENVFRWKPGKAMEARRTHRQLHPLGEPNHPNLVPVQERVVDDEVKYGRHRRLESKRRVTQADEEPNADDGWAPSAEGSEEEEEDA